MVKRFLVFSIISLFTLCGLAYALAAEKKEHRRIAGIVKEVDLSNDTIIVEGKTKRGPKDIRFWTNEDTKYQGITSIEELEANDEVIILVKRAKKKNWATKVSFKNFAAKETRTPMKKLKKQNKKGLETSIPREDEPFDREEVEKE